MADQDNELPEGTDKVIAGATVTENEEALIVSEPTARDATAKDRAIDKLKTGSEKLSGQAAEKARGFVGQGLERSGEALANVSKLVGDTAAGLDERLGSEYGDYARKAASAIEEAANKVSAKDPDELIDEGMAYAKAELGLAKATAEAKADSAKKPIMVGFAALLFLQAAATVLAITIALALATLVGPLAGGLIATLVTLGIAALLGLWAKKLWETRQ